MAGTDAALRICISPYCEAMPPDCYCIEAKSLMDIPQQVPEASGPLWGEHKVPAQRSFWRCF